MSSCVSVFYEFGTPIMSPIMISVFIPYLQTLITTVTCIECCRGMEYGTPGPIFNIG